MIFENFKEALSDLLIEKRISLFQLANMTGISPTAINKIASGKTTNIRMDTIKRIEDGTGYKARIENNRILFYDPDETHSLTKAEKINEIGKILDFLPDKKRDFLINVITEITSFDFGTGEEDEFESTCQEVGKYG